MFAIPGHLCFAAAFVVGSAPDAATASVAYYDSHSTAYQFHHIPSPIPVVTVHLPSCLQQDCNSMVQLAFEVLAVGHLLWPPPHSSQTGCCLLEPASFVPVECYELAYSSGIAAEFQSAFPWTAGSNSGICSSGQIGQYPFWHIVLLSSSIPDIIQKVNMCFHRDSNPMNKISKKKSINNTRSSPSSSSMALKSALPIPTIIMETGKLVFAISTISSFVCFISLIIPSVKINKIKYCNPLALWVYCAMAFAFRRMGWNSVGPLSWNALSIEDYGAYDNINLNHKSFNQVIQ